MQELSRKNALFTDSVIRRMTRVALDCGAINLAQGFPDFDPPKAMTDRLAEVAHTGPHQYPITMGAPNFREALARKCGRFMGRELDPNTDMVVTIGSTEAMVDTIFALTNPGDRIVIEGVGTLRDGTQIQPITPEAAAAKIKAATQPVNK